MRHYLFYLLIIVVTLSACKKGSNGLLSRTKRNAKTSAPSGKYSNPTIFSKVNPFQGRAKRRLAKSKKKKFKLFKRNKKKSEKDFNKRNRLNKGRIKSSGSRGGGNQGSNNKKGKNLFDNKKE